MINDVSIGVDMEDVRRFERFKKRGSHRFLSRVFTKAELKYCFSQANSAERLAARYAAKEAAVKALGAFGLEKIEYKDIEIRKRKNGALSVVFHSSPYKKINAMISISHSGDMAIGFCLLSI